MTGGTGFVGAAIVRELVGRGDDVRVAGRGRGLPVPIALGLAEAAAASRMRAPVSVDEVRSAAQWWTYRSTKAKRELGWKARPHEETIEATVQWWLERDSERIAAAQNGGARRRLADAALGGTAVALGFARRARRTVLV